MESAPAPEAANNGVETNLARDMDEYHPDKSQDVHGSLKRRVVEIYWTDAVKDGVVVK